MRISGWICAAWLALAMLASCGPTYRHGPPAPGPGDIAALEAAIRALDPQIDAAEARRAAALAYRYPLTLAEAYGITDAPIVHNMKVNAGTKARGLCWHWADDLQARLAAENFRTLSLHRAIANHDKRFRIEHSTVIVSAAGADMSAGLVLDPWRWGGKLYWGAVTQDPRYDWAPRAAVFEWKRSRNDPVREGAEPVR